VERCPNCRLHCTSLWATAQGKRPSALQAELQNDAADLQVGRQLLTAAQLIWQPAIGSGTHRFIGQVCWQPRSIQQTLQTL
jgi:hypothetical protein